MPTTLNTWTSYYTTLHIAIFEEAKAVKIHRSVQAGEFGPSDAVFQAIEKLGAERIVGGYSVLQEGTLQDSSAI